MQDAQDASGLMFRRNRYYDANTGRFTQEDPVGLAGGLNAYGFAQGDPVNYSDPYGLCVAEQDKNGQNVNVSRYGWIAWPLERHRTPSLYGHLATM